MGLNWHQSLPMVFWLDENLKKKKKKKKKDFFFIFFRETPISPLDQYRAKFRPLGPVFCPKCPQTEPLLFSMLDMHV